MKIKINYTVFLIFLLLILGCDNSTQPEKNYGSISGNITIGNYDLAPQNELTLKLYKDIDDNLVQVDSTVIENGEYRFEKLSDGLYSVCFEQDENYTPFRNWEIGDGLCQSYEILESSEKKELDFHLFAWHHFTQDTVFIEVDTTGWQSKSISSKFYNDGVRDTLIWNMNENQIPNWLNITPTSGSYSPESSSDKWLSISIRKGDFPKSMWSQTLTLEISHQFGLSYIFIVFKVV